MQSIKSTALEPTAPELEKMSGGQKIARLIPVYGLPICMVLLIVLFSILLPNTFPTMLNFRSILGDKAIIAILSLAAMIPMMAGRIDLTVGYGIVLWHIMAIALQTNLGLDWRVVVVIVLLSGCLLGLLNGLLVEIARIDSFIATLGTGTILYAVALWYTEGRQIVGVLPKGFTELYSWQPLGIPVVAYYVLALSLVLWIITEYTPIGRCLYAIGANPRAAELNGIPNRRFIIGAFVVAGLLGAFAGAAGAAVALVSGDVNDGFSGLGFWTRCRAGPRGVWRADQLYEFLGVGHGIGRGRRDAIERCAQHHGREQNFPA